jgi:coenzyme F420-0:L-glutamate ligase / coenzyme F420-1:gamma-L-glutamate ligase
MFSDSPNSLETLLMSRRSVRRYLPTPVPEAVIETILKAAIWAPSAHNRQPWRFAVIQSQQSKIALADAMGAQLRLDLASDGVSPDVIEADAGRSYSRITMAPLIILLALSMADMDTYPDARRASHEHTMAVQSLAMAGQNVLLAAHAQGLGACWMCAPLFCPLVVRTTLDLPEDWEPQGMISLGYPAETRTKTRHPLESRVLWR